jgi:hypothetical protein
MSLPALSIASASRSFATISSGRCFFRRLVVIESLLPKGVVDLHTDWIRISKAGQRNDGRSVFDKQAYKRRSIVEQTIGWLKECHRIGTRFEKLAINFLAMMKLAMIQRRLRMTFSDRA